jgi:hypothetical protein
VRLVVLTDLHDDLTLNCDSDEYKAMLNSALLLILLWPIGNLHKQASASLCCFNLSHCVVWDHNMAGVPLVYALLLWMSRKAIRSGVQTQLSRATEFLWADYDSSSFLWEPLEMCRKLALTGWLVPLVGLEFAAFCIFSGLTGVRIPAAAASDPRSNRACTHCRCASRQHLVPSAASSHQTVPAVRGR